MWFPLIALLLFFFFFFVLLSSAQTLFPFPTSLLSSSRKGRKAHCCLEHQTPDINKSKDWHWLMLHCPPQPLLQLLLNTGVVIALGSAKPEVPPKSLM